jgi:hypothetical protein
VERLGSADPVIERSPVTRIEHNRAKVAPILHHGSGASAQNADDGHIGFLIMFYFTSWKGRGAL